MGIRILFVILFFLMENVSLFHHHSIISHLLGNSTVLNATNEESNTTEKQCISNNVTVTNSPFNATTVQPGVNNSENASKCIADDNYDDERRRQRYDDPIFLACAEGVNTFLTGIGLVGNSFTILKIAADKTLHRPTYVAIWNLAIADFFSLAFGYIDAYRLPKAFWQHPVKYGIFSAVQISFEHSSGAHTVFMAVLRYLLICKPLWSKMHLTNGMTMKISICLWIYSMAAGSAYGTYVYYYFADLIQGLSTFLAIEITKAAYFFVFPTSLVLIFHSLKICALKTAFASNRELSRRMSRMLLVILTIYNITCLADIMFRGLIVWDLALGFSETSEIVLFYMTDGVFFLWMLHYAINPFIYFVFSPPVRRLVNTLRGKSTVSESKESKESRDYAVYTIQ